MDERFADKVCQPRLIQPSTANWGSAPQNQPPAANFATTSRRSRIPWNPLRELSEIRHFGSSLPWPMDRARVIWHGEPCPPNETLSRYSRAGTRRVIWEWRFGNSSVVPPWKKSYPNLPDMSVQVDHPKLAVTTESPDSFLLLPKAGSTKKALRMLKPKVAIQQHHLPRKRKASQKFERLGNFLVVWWARFKWGNPGYVEELLFGYIFERVIPANQKPIWTLLSPIQRGCERNLPQK